MGRLAEVFGGRPGGSGPGKPGENGNTPYYVHTDSNDRVELVFHARAAGRENLPETSADEPNDVETAVYREHERRHRDLIERTRTALHDLTEAFARQEEKLPATRDLHQQVEDASAARERDLAADSTILPLRQTQQHRRRDLRMFMRERQLARDAEYPASKLLHLGLVGLVVVAESLANLGFFADASELGLVGGLLLAIGASLLNVVIGLTAGYFLRWRNHPARRLRHLATLGIMLYAAGAIAFNWSLANWRDLAAASREITHTGELLTRDPLSLSFHSLALFLVGIVASGLAVWKGYRLDDPMPGYSGRHRAFVAADRELARACGELGRSVLAHAQSVPDRCRSVIRQASDVLEELGRITVRAEQSLESYEAERERLQRWCHQWLRRYRSENLSIRTAPAPAYFSAYPSFPSEVDAGPVNNLKARLLQAVKAVDRLKVEAHRITSEQSARIVAAQHRFEIDLTNRFHSADHGRGDGSSVGDRRLPGAGEQS